MFTGFTPETVDFLWGIRMNNNREWFLEHKKQYVETLYEPMKELGKELFPLIQDRPGNLMKVSRIYRDARLHHPLPYKESLWICIRQDVEWWGEAPFLFFEIRPEGISYGFCVWKPKVSTMDAFRQEIGARSEEFLELVRKTESDVGQRITADCYKKPKPTDREELRPYYAWKGNISLCREENFGPETFGPELLPRVKEYLEKLLPIYDYFCRFGS